MSIDIEQLTHDHKKAVHTVDGLEIHTVPALIAQLREALFAGLGADGAGGGHRSKLPLQAAALDLYMLIDRQITEVWVAAFHRVPNADRPEQLLAEWAAWAGEESIVPLGEGTVYATAAVAHWVTLIEDYLNPPRRAEINAPCVQCGERYTYRSVDGETVRSAALTFTRSKDTGDTLDARCGACAAVWLPSQFLFLAEQIGRVIENEGADHGSDVRTDA